MSEKCRRRDLKYHKKNIKKKKRLDYLNYQFSINELLRYFTEGFVVIGIFGYFFYRSVWAVILLSPGIFLYIKNKKKSLCRNRKNELFFQFKDALNSVNASLQAGYSLENAFCEAYREMSEYHGSESVIAKELHGIKKGIQNNLTVEDLLDELAERSGLSDISDFAGVLRVGKISGGTINTIFENSITVIEEKITVQQEILTLISAKRLETLIMCIIPFFIIFYVDITSKGYFEVMYTSAAGRIIMSICMGVYIAAYLLAQKIMEIEV